MTDYQKEFIDFMIDSQVLKFGEFTLKSGRKSPFFMNAGAYVTGSQLMRLGEYYARAIHENFGDELIIYSDSAYLINGITSWINSWRINNWMNSKKEPVKNQELWKILDELLDDFKKKYNVSFKKVRGHSGIYWNEVCDKLANEAMDGI